MELERFIKAQEKKHNGFEIALKEINTGKKINHWMWYIFPQFKGLGRSSTSEFYAIQSIEEAKEYLAHPILGKRLREISKALLSNNQNDAILIFGFTDSLKLKSCMTLFSFVDNSAEKTFQKILDKFFSGYIDEITMEKITTMKKNIEK